MLREQIPEVLDLAKTIEEFKTAKEYKFIYLVYAVSKTSKYFTPYTFKIVSYADISTQSFFTLSNEGLMSHFETDVTFTPFANFEEDFRFYQKITQVSRDIYQPCFYHVPTSNAFISVQLINNKTTACRVIFLTILHRMPLKIIYFVII